MYMNINNRKLCEVTNNTIFEKYHCKKEYFDQEKENTDDSFFNKLKQKIIDLTKNSTSVVFFLFLFYLLIIFLTIIILMILMSSKNKLPKLDKKNNFLEMYSFPIPPPPPPPPASFVPSDNIIPIIK